MTEKERDRAWDDADFVRGKSAAHYRRDRYGRVMYRNAYDNGHSNSWVVKRGRAVAKND